MIKAFKNGVSTFDETTMNAMLSAQPSSLIFDGDQAAAIAGSGVVENDLSLADLSQTFTLTGQTTIGRIELDIKKYGTGSDITLKILDGATELISIKFPAKLFSAGYISLPVDLSGLTAGHTYTIKLIKAGDSTNRLVWIGESSSSYHYKVFANTPGTYQLKHGIYGTNAKTWLEYNGDGTIKDIWRWLPAIDSGGVVYWQIVDKLTPTYDSNNVAVKWGVS